MNEVAAKPSRAGGHTLVAARSVNDRALAAFAAVGCRAASRTSASATIDFRSLAGRHAADQIAGHMRRRRLIRETEAAMRVRFIRLSIALSTGLLVAACASVGSFIGDSLPTWAGGLPPGAPPRAGTPGYDAYLKSVGEGQAPTAPPAAAPAAPPRQPTEPVDEPIH